MPLFFVSDVFSLPPTNIAPSSTATLASSSPSSFAMANLVRATIFCTSCSICLSAFCRYLLIFGFSYCRLTIKSIPQRSQNTFSRNSMTELPLVFAIIVSSSVTVTCVSSVKLHFEVRSRLYKSTL